MKDKIIKFRLSTEDLEFIQRRAKELKMSVSCYVLKSALQNEIVIIPEVKEFRTELVRIGNNLNQLTVLAHKGSIQFANLNELCKGIDNIWQSLSLLRKKRTQGRR